MEVGLVIPEKKYIQSYLEACRESKAAGESRYSLRDPDRFGEWKDELFVRMENFRNGVNLPDGYVQASTFWLIEEGEYIGEGNIRHTLNPFLERFGGHIGYAIRPSKRGRGYGTLQLALLLAEADRLGIKSALITCDEDNIASARLIEKNGGVYRDTVDNVINGQPRRTRRYRVDTSALPKVF